jgi:cytochrome c peroxidase
MKHTSVIGILLVIVFCFQYCSKTETATASTANNPTATGANIIPQPVLPSSPFSYAGLPLPAYILACLATEDNTPANNPTTDNGATLGRVLFYDKNLSRNNTTSCGSCHRADLSFSDSAIKSRGFEGGATDRHSMSLLNVRFYRSGKMFWDERANSLEEQVLMPIQNATEMGMVLTELETKLGTLSYYPALFEKAFGTTQISAERISKALSQFVRSIITYRSKYDQVKQGLASFTADERDGETLFMTAGNITCAGCHAPPMFITSNPQTPFALLDPSDPVITNQRRAKSGSLRNIANTAPYFHNGSIPSLQAMLGVAGIQPIPQHTVAPQDRQKILAFLQTLTDTVTIRETKYRDPFN